MILFTARLIYRGISYQNLINKQKQEKKMIENAKIVKEVEEKTNNEQTNIYKVLLDNKFLNEYTIKKLEDKYILKDKNENIILDNIDQYLNTSTSLFVFSKEDGLYAFNTETNKLYDPYVTSFTIDMVKGEEKLNYIGLVYKENDKIYVLTNDNLYNVSNIQGDITNSKNVKFDLDSKTIIAE